MKKTVDKLPDGTFKIPEKPIISFDFDGVIYTMDHSKDYNDSHTVGIDGLTNSPIWTVIRYLKRLIATNKYKVVIFSARNFVHNGIQGMLDYLHKHGLDEEETDQIEFPLYKPAWAIHVDDKVLRYENDYLTLEKLDKILKEMESNKDKQVPSEVLATKRFNKQLDGYKFVYNPKKNVYEHQTTDQTIDKHFELTNTEYISFSVGTVLEGLDTEEFIVVEPTQPLDPNHNEAGSTLKKEYPISNNVPIDISMNDMVIKLEKKVDDLNSELQLMYEHQSNFERAINEKIGRFMDNIWKEECDG